MCIRDRSSTTTENRAGNGGETRCTPNGRKSTEQCEKQNKRNSEEGRGKNNNNPQCRKKLTVMGDSPSDRIEVDVIGEEETESRIQKRPKARIVDGREVAQGRGDTDLVVRHSGSVVVFT